MMRYKGLAYQRRDKNDTSKDKNGQDTTTPNFPTTSCQMMDFDLGSWVTNAKALVPVSDLIKIPSQREKLLKLIESPSNEEEDRNNDIPIMIQSMEERKGRSYPPFFIYLHINDLILHNCMLDPRAATNVMPLKVMKQLGLKINRPCRRVCGIDSKRIEACGLIKDLQIHLVAHPQISLLMDVVVIDVPNAWGMLLSRGWGAMLGGTLQMDLSYATIPLAENTFVTLHGEPERNYHVEDPQDSMNELMYEENDLGNYVVSNDFSMPPKVEIPELKKEESWKKNFDGAHSRTRTGVGI